jgi:LysW-gamma-L-alpha-aminoadipyl-6-phosphate/LysW-L-glutamyl-5-phosphate reductase
MNETINISIVGGSGYTGGELLRLSLLHPNVNINHVSSNSFTGKFYHKAHPNLRKLTQEKFVSHNEIGKSDLLFLCTPHGHSMKNIDKYLTLSDKVIDLSADFRLRDLDLYQKWYGEQHLRPDLLDSFVYGIPEFYRNEMADTKLISSAGCNATTAILGLFPLFAEKIASKAFIDVKVGSSEGGVSYSLSSHHPERSGSVRSYKPVGHRHTAEIIQELPNVGKITLSATSIDMVRGVLATSQVPYEGNLTEKDLWKAYRKYYGNEPFIRIVKEKEGVYRFPEPKLLVGTNYCDVGFELDEDNNRIVVISAIDNLMKGAAGQAVQAMNIMFNFNEQTGLEFPGLHPI